MILRTFIQILVNFFKSLQNISQKGIGNDNPVSKGTRIPSVTIYTKQEA